MDARKDFVPVFFVCCCSHLVGCLLGWFMAAFQRSNLGSRGTDTVQVPCFSVGGRLWWGNEALQQVDLCHATCENIRGAGG